MAQFYNFLNNFCWFSFMVLNNFTAMKRIHLISFNLNGCRQSFKRAQVLECLDQKRVGVALLQETHSDVSNDPDWRADWKGKCVLSHGSNNSAGVAVIFEPGLEVDILKTEEIILKVTAKIEDFSYIF